MKHDVSLWPREFQGVNAWLGPKEHGRYNFKDLSMLQGSDSTQFAKNDAANLSLRKSFAPPEWNKRNAKQVPPCNGTFNDLQQQQTLPQHD